MADINEIMRYLGYELGKYDEKTLIRVNEISEDIEKTIKPKWTFKELSIKEKNRDSVVIDSSITLTGEAITKHLSESDRVYVMGATLGIDADRYLLRKSSVSGLEGMIADACLSSLVEEGANDCEEYIRTLVNDDEQLTFRFSPGYGDLSTSVQESIIKNLSFDKILGITLTDSFIMIPKKSVIAIIGVEKKTKKGTSKVNRCGNDNCSLCELNHKCNIRK